MKTVLPSECLFKLPLFSDWQTIIGESRTPVCRNASSSFPSFRTQQAELDHLAEELSRNASSSFPSFRTQARLLGHTGEVGSECLFKLPLFSD